MTDTSNAAEGRKKTPSKKWSKQHTANFKTTMQRKFGFGLPDDQVTDEQRAARATVRAKQAKAIKKSLAKKAKGGGEVSTPKQRVKWAEQREAKKKREREAMLEKASRANGHAVEATSTDNGDRTDVMSFPLHVIPERAVKTPKKYATAASRVEAVLQQTLAMRSAVTGADLPSKHRLVLAVTNLLASILE